MESIPKWHPKLQSARTRKHASLGKPRLSDLEPLKLMLRRSLRQIVTLIVGEGDKSASFAVYENVLCEASPFFKAACKPEWIKPEDSVTKLPEDDPNVVQGMIYWIYHNEICLPAELNKTSSSGYTEKDAMELTWGVLVRTYILGQKYQIPGLQNDAIDGLLILRIQSYLPLGMISYAYRHTIPGSPLRSVILDTVGYEIQTKHLEKWSEDYCGEFLFDMTKSYLTIKDSGDSDYGEEAVICKLQKTFCVAYHSHCDGFQLPCKKLKELSTASKIDTD
jgi:hypothetical protein